VQPLGSDTPATKPSVRQRLDAAAPEERATMLVELVRTEVAAVLKLPDPASLHPDKLLQELGMDSLMGVDIRRRLEKRLSMQLPPTLVFDQPSCGALVAHLIKTWTVPQTVLDATNGNGAATPSLRRRIDAAAPDERAKMLHDLVRAEVAAVLKLRDPVSLHPDKLLQELGMDSLMAVDIRRRLEKRLSTQLPPTLVFDRPSCGALVSYLVEVCS